MRGWRRRRGWRMVGFVARRVYARWSAGCNPAPVTSRRRRRSTPIASCGEIRRDRRAAVHDRSASGDASRRAPAAEPLPEPPGDTRDAGGAHRHARAQRDWQLVDEPHRRRSAPAARTARCAPPTPSEARAVGRLLARRRRSCAARSRSSTERIGTELAAKRPAHRRSLAVEFVRHARTALGAGRREYAEQQQSLSENLWNLPGSCSAGGHVGARLAELAAIASQSRALAHRSLRSATDGSSGAEEAAKRGNGARASTASGQDRTPRRRRDAGRRRRRR